MTGIRPPIPWIFRRCLEDKTCLRPRGVLASNFLLGISVSPNQLRQLGGSERRVPAVNHPVAIGTEESRSAVLVAVSPETCNGRTWCTSMESSPRLP